MACDNSDEIAQTEATIELKLPLTSNQLKSNQMESYEFSGYATFCLAKKDNVQNCPNNILKVMPGTGAVLSIPVQAENQSISDLVITWGYASKGSQHYNMQPPIELMKNEADLKNGLLDFNLDHVLLPLINNMNLSPDNYFKIVINGKTEFELNLTATMEVPIIVEHENLSIRFSVF
jgi:hypothetical protein